MDVASLLWSVNLHLSAGVLHGIDSVLADGHTLCGEFDASEDHGGLGRRAFATFPQLRADRFFENL